MSSRPPKKQKDVPTGPRHLNGAVAWDVRTFAAEMGETEKTARSQVARRQVPFRKLGGRIIFLPEEIREYLAQLPGVTLDEALANLKTRAGR